MVHHLHPFETLVWVRDTDGYPIGKLLMVVTLFWSALTHMGSSVLKGGKGVWGGNEGSSDVFWAQTYMHILKSM